MREDYPQDLMEITRFHGHLCPGVVIGYRAAKAARNHLGSERPGDEELVAIVETDACGVDAIQYLLGCTLGKGNLIFRDHGKQVFTVIQRATHRAVRVAMRGEAFQRTPEEEALIARVREGKGADEDRAAFDRLQEEKINHLLGLSEEAFFRIDEVSVEIPEKARIFKTVACKFCGEPVMEPRARVRDGGFACIPCAESYSRGW
jgi:formylmethanofuran dehydrogenase subunit E